MEFVRFEIYFFIIIILLLLRAAKLVPSSCPDSFVRHDH